jgi:hypothetical protein
MFHKPFLAKTQSGLRKRGISMFKYWLIVGAILTSGAAHSEPQSPWFGSDATVPEQIAIKYSATKTQDFSQNGDCTIYSCSSLVKIAMPLQNSDANP